MHSLELLVIFIEITPEFGNIILPSLPRYFVGNLYSSVSWNKSVRTKAVI